MKKLIFSIALLFFGVAVLAQSPNLMSYQAIIRNASNQLIVNAPIGVRVSVLQGSATGTVVFRETYNPNPTTNSNGLLGLNIGSGLSIIGSFAQVNWSQGPYFVQVEADPSGGTNYSISSVSQLLSVPYALHAKTADVPGLPGPQGPIGQTGPTGPQGPIGLTGPQGPAGNDGAIGPQGIQGVQGPVGSPGPQGSTGPSGVGVTQTQVIGDSLFITLSNALPLNAGHVRGLQGVPGSQGPIGLTGPQGVPGNDGATGPQGPAGSNGSVGPQGPIGLTGPQGPAGSDGAVGPQGPIGLTGAVGPAGSDGAVGPQGPIGLTGPQGPQGPAGSNGAVGLQGPIGLTGSAGPSGVGVTQTQVIGDSLFITLSNGLLLNAGHVRGLQGVPGSQGPIGLTGPAGPQGPIGLTGPQGSFPSGTQPGEINYWNGTTWVSVPPGTRGQFLVFCDGIPTWGGCLPQVTTSPIIIITSSGAKTGGNVSSDGGSQVTARGVVYGTTVNPTLSNSFTTNGTGTGLFTSVLTGLSPLTTYYFRAYATNSVGTSYGNELDFTTINFMCGTTSILDIDGNAYNTVQIGTQCWMQSNLKVSKYWNGDNIPTGLSNSDWRYTTSGAYAIYNNDPVNDGLYGKLYNHYAVTDSRGLCPTGWHVPSDGEWNILVKYLDPNADTLCGNCWQSSTAGGALKSTATQPTPGGWLSPNTGATNSSGFTALPGGLRFLDGDFYSISNLGYWWSSSVSSGSDAWVRTLYDDLSPIYRTTNFRTYGFSVRCCRD